MQNATQNIVDAFLTRDGLDINDDENYSEEGFAQKDDPDEYGKDRNEIKKMRLPFKDLMIVIQTAMELIQGEEDQGEQ